MTKNREERNAARRERRARGTEANAARHAAELEAARIFAAQVAAEQRAKVIAADVRRDKGYDRTEG